jgi:hypothetical protein
MSGSTGRPCQRGVGAPAGSPLGFDDVHQRVGQLRKAGVAIESEPHLIFTHENDVLGPAGKEEWMAFIRDSEGNLVGLVSHAAARDWPENRAEADGIA